MSYNCRRSNTYKYSTEIVSNMSDMESKKREILNYLHKVAREDRILSQSEQKIIKLVEESLDEYENELEKALEDGVITSDERVELYYKRMDILKEAIAISQDDDIIEGDEDSLLTALTKKLKELGKMD